MTPEEQANQLVKELTLSSNAQDGSWMCEDLAKRCAIITVDKLIECTPSVDIYPPNYQSIHPRVREYWKQVKQELINK